MFRPRNLKSLEKGVHSRTMLETTVHLEGVLLVDKPTGITSHDVVDRVRRLLGFRKVGHTGTLDPFATGVMVLCIGQATRAAKYFEGLDKAYRAVLKLGEVTDTGDSDGVVVEARPLQDFSRELLEVVLEPFRGTITQRPPAYSAVKVAGERLYAKARRGEKIDAPPREVIIKKLAVESFEEDRLTLLIECSKGTYIRSLAYDIGKRLGCGAHCLRLTRTMVGPFALEEATTLGLLEELGCGAATERLLRLDDALSHFMEPISLTTQGASLISHGSPVEEDFVLQLPATIRLGETYRALDGSGRLIAIVEAQERPQGFRWAPRRVLTDRI